MSSPSPAAQRLEPRARTQVVAGLRFPEAPPSRPERPHSALSTASAQYARARATALTQGDGPMALSLDLGTLANTTELVEGFTSYGTNINTARKDDHAWERWEEVCSRFDTSPMRTAEDVRSHPERSTHLMACLLLHAFAMGKPRGSRGIPLDSSSNPVRHSRTP